MDSSSSFEDTLYTIDKSGRRKWVYPHIVPGRYVSRRSLVAYLLMAVYLLMPWIQISGRQGILLDIPARRFLVLGTEFWATDTFYLVLILFGLGLSLFLFTSLLGRVWCGWACPETVFLEFLFRPIERLIEGSDQERRRLDSAPWTSRKVFKKALKHGICALAAWGLASTALAYFVGRETLLTMMTDWPWNNLQPFLMTLALMGLMAFQFGWFREQFCTVVCPYARFQSVLMDQNSLLVGYDSRRGEPRGKLRQKSETKAGDCVDCGLCVRVCPTGIDIRNGTQLECIACAACADACDSVMAKIGRPLGLVRYDTEARLLGQSGKFWRPRVLVYAGILVAVAALLVTSLGQRDLSDVELLRAKSEAVFVLDAGGLVTNQFELRVSNKSSASKLYSILPSASSEYEFVTPLSSFSVAARQSIIVPVFVRAAAAKFKQGSLNIALSLSEEGGKRVHVQQATLLGPVSTSPVAGAN